MNDKEYSAMDGIRRSDLWVIDRSPLHFKYHMEHPSEQTSAMRFGSAYHKYILERETFEDEFYIIPDVDKRTKAGKEAVREAEEQNPGKTGITAEEFQQIQDMREMLLIDPNTRPYIEAIENGDARTEVPFCWIDKETGEVCKCKADAIFDEGYNPTIVDFKTCASCADRAFQSDMKKYGYLFQAGFYCEGIDFCTMEKHSFIFIGQEKTAPYAPRLYILDEPEIDAGKDKFHELLNEYHDCKEIGVWHGYEEEYIYVD